MQQIFFDISVCIRIHVYACVHHLKAKHMYVYCTFTITYSNILKFVHLSASIEFVVVEIIVNYNILIVFLTKKHLHNFLFIQQLRKNFFCSCQGIQRVDIKSFSVLYKLYHSDLFYIILYSLSHSMCVWKCGCIWSFQKKKAIDFNIGTEHIMHITFETVV